MVETISQVGAEKRMMSDHELLCKIFPLDVIDRLKREEAVLPTMFSNVSIMFCDIVGFTELASSCTPMQTHIFLDEIFLAFDTILASFPKLYKVESIGGEYST